MAAAVIIDDVRILPTRQAEMSIYDRPIDVATLHTDPDTGAEHYLVRYPPGLGVKRHRHSASHTIVVLSGRLDVGDRVLGPGGYCHFPAGEAMVHAPVGDAPCVFVTVFDGPVDAEPVAP